VFADATKVPTLAPTLALVAAEEANPNITSRKRLASILKSEKSPFSRFNPRNTFNKYSALAVLCGSAATAKSSWANCSEEPDALSGELQGKIVLIGEYSSCDKHDTVLGSMYGVDLQANYIAALLSDDVYVAVGDTVKNAFYVAFWFLVVQAIFASVRPLPRAAAWCGFIWAVIFIASLVWLAGWGRLFTFWFQGLNLGVIALTWAEYWLHGMSVHRK
jgi:CHASE2 domain-containing sensor protein